MPRPRGTSQVTVGERQVAFRGAGGSGVVGAPGAWGQRAFGSALSQLQGPLSQIGAQEAQKAAKAAEQQSSDAGEIYGATTELADIQLPTGNSVGEEAFRRSAILSAQVKAEVAARDDIEELAKLHPGQPEAFRKALDTQAQKFLSDMPDFIKGPAARAYTEIGSRRYLELDDERRKLVADEAGAAALHAHQMYTTDAEHLARQGDFQGAVEKIGQLAEFNDAAGPVAQGGAGALSLMQIEEMSQKAISSIQDSYLTGWVERQKSPRAALAGLRSGKTGDAVTDNVLKASDQKTIDHMARELESNIKQQEAEAERAAAKAKQEAILQATGVFDDAKAAAMRGAPMPDASWQRKLTAAYGDKAASMIDEVYQTRDATAVASSFGTQTLEEINAKVAAHDPANMSNPGKAEGGAGFAAKQDLYERLGRAAQQTIEARVKDPAGEAMKAFPSIGQGFASGDPTQISAAMRESARVQKEVFGLPDNQIKILPPAAVGQVVDAFKAAPTADERLAVLRTYTNLGDDEMSRRVLGQLEDKGLPASARFAMEALNEDGEPTRARAIMGGIAVDPKDLPKLGETKDKDVTSAVDAIMGGSGPAAISTRTANLSQEPGMFQRAAGERETLLRMTRQYAAGGMEPEEAAAKAESVLYGGRGVAGNDDLGHVRAPAGVDTDKLTNGMEAARASLDIAYMGPKPTGNQAQDALAQRDWQAHVDDIRSGGIWVEAEGGYALMDPSGALIRDPNDPSKPRVWTAEELVTAGAGIRRSPFGAPGRIH